MENKIELYFKVLDHKTLKPKEEIKLLNSISEYEKLTNEEKYYIQDRLYLLNKEILKPPLGLQLHKYWVDERITNILQAVNRYIEDDREIPTEWIEEYNQLIKEMESKKQNDS